MTDKLCKATYTDEATGAQVACTGKPEGPQPAVFGLRGGGVYCRDCWPKVEAHFLGQYPGQAKFALRGLQRMTRRL